MLPVAFDPFPRRRPRRRSLLAGGAAGALSGLLSGCTGSEDPAAREAERASASQQLRSREARRSETLLERYEATLHTHPELAERLDPLRRTVERHAAAFGGGQRGRPAEASGSPSAGGAPRPEGSPVASAPAGDPSAARPARHPVPEEPRRALAALAEAERQATDARTAVLVKAPPELARLLASVAAAGAAHVYLLGADD